MKFAVFQVCEVGGKARLICIEMSSLQSAANLKHWLRMNVGPRTEICLLGRFESICVAITEEEVEHLVLGDDNRCHKNTSMQIGTIPQTLAP